MNVNRVLLTRVSGIFAVPSGLQSAQVDRDRTLAVEEIDHRQGRESGAVDRDGGWRSG